MDTLLKDSPPVKNVIPATPFPPCGGRVGDGGEITEISPKSHLLFIT